MTPLAILLLGACICILAHDNHQTRKALKHMSQQLDNLTAQVTNLETQAAAAVAALQTAGTDGPALDALATRVKTVADSLQAAAAPKAVTP